MTIHAFHGHKRADLRVVNTDHTREAEQAEVMKRDGKRLADWFGANVPGGTIRAFAEAFARKYGTSDSDLKKGLKDANGPEASGTGST